MTVPLWPGPLFIRETLGRLTINSIDMHCPAWNVLDLLPLWMHTAVRGENVIIPGMDGRLAQPLHLDQGDYSLPMIISGVVDRNGAAYPSRWVGLETNIEFLRVNVANPPTAPTATRAATLLMPSGATRTGNVQVVSLDIVNRKDTTATAEALLNLRVPAVRLT